MDRTTRGLDPFQRAPVTSRAIVVDQIRARGTLSRVELSQITGLSAPTVSGIVKRLLQDGMVEEVGRGISSGGKPPTILQVIPEFGYVAGVHLSFHAISYVLVDFAGNVISRWRRPGRLADSHPRDFVDLVRVQLDELLRRSGIDHSRLIGVGAAAPGPLTRDAGFLSAPPSMTDWAGFPLRAELEQRLGVPVLLDNDASCAAMGTRLSTEHDDSTVAVLFMSDGIGAGLRIGGEVFAGAHGNAGEVGHVCVDIQGPTCWCGATGCLEVMAGPATLTSRAQDLGLLTSDGTRSASAMESFSLLARQALHGDERASALLAESARWMALAGQTVVVMFDAQLLVLTGPGFAVAGPLYLPAIIERVGSSAFSRVTDVEVVMDDRGHDAAPIGAALMALRSETAVAV